MWLNSLIVRVMFNYKQCHFNILNFSFLFHGCNRKWWYLFNGNIGMCDLQAEAWFLHTVLQVFHSLSCNVRLKGRLSHGGKILHSVMHVYVMFFTIYSECPSKYMKKKRPTSIIYEGAAFLWRLCLDFSIDQQNYCIDCSLLSVQLYIVFLLMLLSYLKQRWFKISVLKHISDCCWNKTC